MQKSKRTSRLTGARMAFFVAAAFLWLVVALVLLDVCQGMKYRRVEKSNAYVRASRLEIPWPAAEDNNSFLVPAPPSADRPEKSPQALLEDRFILRASRAAYFESLSDEDREQFCRSYHQKVLLVEPIGGISKTYPPLNSSLSSANAASSTIETLFAEDTAVRLREAFLQVAATGRALVEKGAIRTDNGEESFHGFVFPSCNGDTPGQKLVFLEKDDPELADKAWESPFLSYKPYFKRSAEGFTTNNFGFRDDDVAVPKPPGVYRILCVGGSTTEEGEANYLTYPNRLEARIRDLFPGTQVEVVNCGITGIQAAGERMRMGDYLALEPDLIVYYNGINDICYNMFREAVDKAARWQRILRSSMFINEHLNGALLPSAARLDEMLEKACFRDLQGLCRVAKEHGIPIAFCSFASPDAERLTKEEYDYYAYLTRSHWGGRYVTFASYGRALRVFNEKLKKLCDDNGAMYIPVAEKIKAGADFFGDICHMRPVGIDAKAQIVFESIRDFVEQSIGKPSETAR